MAYIKRSNFGGRKKMRIAYLRKQARKLGLCVDSQLIFVDDTHRDVVCERKDGKVFCCSQIFLNYYWKKDIERYAYLVGYCGKNKIVKTTKQALDCLKSFGK